MSTSTTFVDSVTQYNSRETGREIEIDSVLVGWWKPGNEAEYKSH